MKQYISTLFKALFIILFVTPLLNLTQSLCAMKSIHNDEQKNKNTEMQSLAPEKIAEQMRIRTFCSKRIPFLSVVLPIPDIVHIVYDYGILKPTAEEIAVANCDLRTAIHSNNEKLLQQALSDGADVNAVRTHDSYGYTMLQDAVLRGRSRIVKILLNNKANVNKKALKINTTPLHNAIEKINLDMIHILINNHADITHYLDTISEILKRKVCSYYPPEMIAEIEQAISEKHTQQSN